MHNKGKLVTEMSYRKRRNLFWVLFIFLLIVMLLFFLYCYENRSSLEKEIVMVDLRGKSLQDVEEYSKTYHLLLEVDYRYDYEVDLDTVISQNIESGKVIEEGDKVRVVISKGKVPHEVYFQYGVNELGSVPIMMYHGIVDIASDETQYIGGNVDKEGYHRTVEAFRGDLEFYYQNGYRMISLNDYIDGNIDVELGKSPIILTFDDGNENNFKVLGEENGELVIDPNCAVGVLEEFKKKYPDYGVTATFFVNSGLFQQDLYNEKILKWLVEHHYDVGNHTMTHSDFTKIDLIRSYEEVGGVYAILEKIIPNSYVSIVALPFGSPYRITHENYQAILGGSYEGKKYFSKGALRVGWEAEVSCFDKEFNPSFLKRIRAYDHNGEEFDIEMNFRILSKNRYVSDGDRNTVVVMDRDRERLREVDKRVICYETK